MSRYIEFSTSSSHRYAPFGGGGALHDNELPTRFLEVRGVRVDGEVQQFDDPTVTERLTMAIRKAAAAKRKGMHYNCVQFAAALQGHATNPQQPFYNPYLHTTDFAVKPDEAWCTPNMAVNLSDSSFDRPLYKSVVIPAYQPGENGAQYLHMLNHDSVVCLSGLQQALDANKCNQAHLADVRPL